MRRLNIYAIGLVMYALSATAAAAQPVPCAGETGKAVVECVERAYPDRLAAGVTLEQRKLNMTFLRDRVIETARCTRIDVGHNCKRGNCHDISLDFIAWKNGGRVEGVDIGAGYDDVNKRLNLQWHTYGPPNYGFPTYQAYGPVSCVGAPPAPPQPPAPPAPDLTPLEQAIAVLQGDTAHLRALVAALELRLTEEADWRTQHDDAIRQQLDEVRARPIPTTCAARGPLGIPVRCELR